MAISNKMSILGTKKAVMAYNGGYYLPSVSDEGILSWSPTVEGMAPIPEVNVRGPQGSDASVTAEAVQAVVPIAWGEYTTAPTVSTNNAIAIGNNALVYEGVAIGSSARCSSMNGVSLGNYSIASGESVAIGGSASAMLKSIAIGFGSFTWNGNCHGSIAIGQSNGSKNILQVSIGSSFTETTDSGNVTHTCTTEGTGSITIGAGANTLNNGDTESSNSVTIGCKASNSGADSVVIGAQASETMAASVVIGSSAKGLGGANQVIIGNRAEGRAIESIAIGAKSLSYGWCSHAVGYDAQSKGPYSTAIGKSAHATAERAQAFGFGTKAADIGVVVFASYSSESLGANQTKTQLYFSGANTPLANTYANGEGIMGYVTTDSEGNMVASGFKRLSALFDEGTMTQPAILNEDGEWEQPKVFKPSDVDMEVEEPSEPAEYQPLPVYPIVEPELEEI